MADGAHRALTETSNKIWLEDMLKSMNLVAMDAKHDQLSIDLLIIINSCIAIFIVVNMGIFLIFLLQQKEMQDAMLTRGKKRRMMAKKEAAYMYLKPSKFCQTIFPEPLYATPPDSHYSKISSDYAFYENADFLEQQQQATPHSMAPVSSRLTPGKSLGASDSSNLWLRVRSTLTGNYSDYRDTASSQPNSSRATSDSKHLDDNRSSGRQPPSRSDSNPAVSSNRCDCDNYINSSSSSPNNRSTDNHSSDNRSGDNRSSDNRSGEHRSSDHRSSDNRGSDNRSSDNRSSDNHSSEHRSSDNDYVNA
ncbi:dentin sialophosphoprotein [Procambarus clarkii]|uniref:dentin sialophosphoprotein n=1 Tax=Procambarus clarkii TaxID=6728 RepID=UPI003742B68E